MLPVIFNTFLPYKSLHLPDKDFHFNMLFSNKYLKWLPIICSIGQVKETYSRYCCSCIVFPWMNHAIISSCHIIYQVGENIALHCYVVDQTSDLFWFRTCPLFFLNCEKCTIFLGKELLKWLNNCWKVESRTMVYRGEVTTENVFMQQSAWWRWQAQQRWWGM